MDDADAERVPDTLPVPVELVDALSDELAAPDCVAVSDGEPLAVTVRLVVGDTEGECVGELDSEPEGDTVPVREEVDEPE